MEWCRGVGGVAEWSVVAVVELWVVDGGGVVEFWNLEMKWNGGWWLVLVEWWYGGCRKSCLCVSFSGVLVALSDICRTGGGGYKRCGKRQPTLKWNGMMLAAGSDGVVVWRPHTNMCVRIVFGGTCVIFYVFLPSGTDGVENDNRRADMRHGVSGLRLLTAEEAHMHQTIGFV